MGAAKVMPVDLAMHTHVNKRPPVSQLCRVSPLSPGLYPKALQPLRAGTAARVPLSPANMLAFPAKATVKKKKRVVFADAKGLALTAVRLFSTDPPASDLDDSSPPATTQDQPLTQGRILRLRLGFPQPSADLPAFLAGLTESLVRLESCRLTGMSLCGTVRVCNISAKKAVQIHVTFDSWRSCWGIPCVQVQLPHADSETDVLAFTVPLPADLSLKDQLEFCVSFRPGLSNIVLWDNNGGQNYRVSVEPVSPEEVPAIWSNILMAEQNAGLSKAQEPSSNYAQPKLPSLTHNVINKTGWTRESYSIVLKK